MQNKTFGVRHAVGAACAAALSLAAIAPAHASDPVIFSFATVGDSRQDPASPDPTTLLAVNPTTGAGAPSLTGTLLPQDAEWLTNSKATTRILRSIAAEKPNLLFFNGDMIYGYGRPVPPVLTGNPSGCTTGAGGSAVTCLPAFSDYTNTVGYPSSAGDNYAAVWYMTAAQQSAAVTLTPDFALNAVQYAFWRGMVANLFETGTYVVPVPGNHETQCNQTKAPWSSTVKNPNCASGTNAYPENENAFRANMGDLVQDLTTNLRFSNVSGFVAQNVSGLTQATAPTGSATDGTAGINNQADLTYSFEVTVSNGEILHFDIINTDPSGIGGGPGGLPLSSIPPTTWLAADFAAAQTRATNAGVPIRFFVFGHKPAWTYNIPGTTLDGFDANPQYGNPFWSLMVQYNATYFCGHEHIPNMVKIADPLGTNPGTATHVIVGSGGSAFDYKLAAGNTEPTLQQPSDRSYGWALVQVHQSGAVTLNMNGFSDTFGPTKSFTWYNTTL